MKFDLSCITLENVPCPLCNTEESDVVVVGCDRIHKLPGKFSVVRCRNCGLMRTNPRPSQETISFYYPDDYGPYINTKVSCDKHTKEPSHLNGRIKKILKPLYRRIFQFNTSVLPDQQPGKMLEIGCASGNFLYQMAKQDWDVEGAEFSPRAASNARKLGFKVYTGAIETAPEPEKKFDLIVMWMVLEHLHDPVAALRKLRSWATADTWLILSVPNAGSMEFKLFKDKWYALQVPTHLYHFTPATITKILEKGGWRVNKIYHQRTLSNLIASIGYVLEDKGCERISQALIAFPERAGKYHLLLYPLAWILSKFGQTGRMTIWARVK